MHLMIFFFKKAAFAFIIFLIKILEWSYVVLSNSETANIGCLSSWLDNPCRLRLDLALLINAWGY